MIQVTIQWPGDEIGVYNRYMELPADAARIIVGAVDDVVSADEEDPTLTDEQREHLGVFIGALDRAAHAGGSS